MRRRGVTLVELMVAAVMTAILAMASIQAFTAAARTQRRLIESYTQADNDSAFAETVRGLLRNAYLGLDDSNPNVAFISTSDMPGLVFTTAGDRLPSSYIESTETFETNNEQYGPRGGVTEVAISTEPVGDAQGRYGIFLRRQTPADSDFSQGGTERLLLPEATNLQFEFFDGTTWLSEWDTRTMNPKRLPSAVRLTLTNAENVNKTFTFAVPTSDATPDNPVSQTGGTE